MSALGLILGWHSLPGKVQTRCRFQAGAAGALACLDALSKLGAHAVHVKLDRTGRSLRPICKHLFIKARSCFHVYP